MTSRVFTIEDNKTYYRNFDLSFNMLRGKITLTVT